jgi:hypothetical protein
MLSTNRLGRRHAPAIINQAVSTTISTSCRWFPLWWVHGLRLGLRVHRSGGNFVRSGGDVVSNLLELLGENTEVRVLADTFH